MNFPRLLTASLFALGLLKATAAPDQWVYVGTYTGGVHTDNSLANPMSQGIYALGFDSQTGKLEPPILVAAMHEPSYLTLHPSGKYLYAVSELDSGIVNAFRVDPSNAHLTLLNSRAALGDAACHINVDATGKMAVIANYTSGDIVSYPLQEDGTLGPPASFIEHFGESYADPDRQEAPHAHSVNFDKENHFVFAADLGCDKIFIYKVDPVTAKLTPHDPPFAIVPPAGGPRHFAFHPSGKFAYVVNEMACTITSFSYDPAKGALTLLETLSLLPPGVAVDPLFSAAAVHVHPSGKFVYGSVRGHDTLACFRIDEATGKLTYIENAPAGVAIPRDFNLDPSGRWLIAAGMDSDSLAVFSIDAQTGKLKPTGQTIKVGEPVCVKFLKRS
jgi:6-phosphogluconolactonase